MQVNKIRNHLVEATHPENSLPSLAGVLLSQKHALLWPVRRCSGNLGPPRGHPAGLCQDEGPLELTPMRACGASRLLPSLPAGVPLPVDLPCPAEGSAPSRCLAHSSALPSSAS